jgi:hypothetical protein
MAHLNENNFALDIIPNIKKTTLKFREMKGRPRWVRLEQRHADYEDHKNTCELIGDEPMPKAIQGHLSAAKLKGSPEYKEKVNKMTEKRERIKTHNPALFETDIRSCGCNKESKEYCFFCAVYGNELELRWLTNPKKPKRRVRDMPCAPLAMPAPKNDWPSYRDILINTPTNEPEFWPRIGQVY